MVFNRFTLLVFIRLLLLFATLTLLAWSFVRGAGIFTLGWLVVLSLLQVWWLFRYLSRTNDELASFLLGLQHQDTMRTYSTGRLERQFANLRHSFRYINEQLLSVRVEKEKQYQLYQALIDQSPTGLLTIDGKGHIPFCNKAALELLGKEEFSRLEHLRSVSTSLPIFLKKLKPGRSEVFPLKDRKSRMLPVSFKRKDIWVSGEMLQLISMSPIREELEHHEIESWQKLIRVLTHEMMNSITPVVTLSKNIEMCLQRLNKDSGSVVDGEYISDAIQSARMIGERSQGLMEFVNTYRSLTLLPDPKPVKVAVKDFMEKQAGVFSVIAREKGIDIEVHVAPENLMADFDEGLVAQAVINLIKNSVEALEGIDRPRIRCGSGMENEGFFISIVDNGSGIPANQIDAVFVPFYTTKEGGSGVGLSLCRQIMAMHKGSVEILSEEYKGTAITLLFP